MGTSYVVDCPLALSERAVEFLRTSSQRVEFARGLTGENLQREIVKVYGSPNDAIVRLLSRLQERYGGLSYESGFFQSSVKFVPVCEPEDSGDELDISYAVETGGPVGASVSIGGEVEVGIDFLGVREFGDLDSLIECDAMFMEAGRLGVGALTYLGSATARAAVDALIADEALGLKPVSVASGLHSYWLASDSMMIYATDVWNKLNGGMSPFVKVWATSASSSERVARALSNL